MSFGGRRSPVISSGFAIRRIAYVCNHWINVSTKLSCVIMVNGLFDILLMVVTCVKMIVVWLLGVALEQIAWV